MSCVESGYAPRLAAVSLALRALCADGFKYVSPDGTCMVSAVRGVDVFRPCFTESRNIGVLLDEGVAKEEVPRGSVVALETA